MKTAITCILGLAILVASVAQARITNMEMIQMAVPADENVKVDYDITLNGELEDEVNIQDIISQMGYGGFIEESDQSEVKEETVLDLEGHDFGDIKVDEGFNGTDEKDQMGGACNCKGRICVCCCILSFTKEIPYQTMQHIIVLIIEVAAIKIMRYASAKQGEPKLVFNHLLRLICPMFLLLVCARVMYVSPHRFYIRLSLQDSTVYSGFITGPKLICYSKGTFKACGSFYSVSNYRLCLRLFYKVGTKVYSCSSHCVSVHGSQPVPFLKKEELEEI